MMAIYGSTLCAWELVGGRLPAGALVRRRAVLRRHQSVGLELLPGFIGELVERRGPGAVGLALVELLGC